MDMDQEVYWEVQEAIEAGNRALDSLYEARDMLKKASNWGVVDLLGGGTFSGVMKHAKVNKASACVDRARYDLEAFRRELSDVDAYLPDVAVGSFLTFADFFFDGFLADMMVQSKISKARKRVKEAISQVEDILFQLNSLL